MEDFEEQLNAILSSPQQMQQIVQFASMLSNQGSESAASSKECAAEEKESPRQNEKEPSHDSHKDAWNEAALLSRILPLLHEINTSENDEKSALLYALKPFLKPSRQGKIDQILQFSKILHVGKHFIRNPENQHV